MNGLAIGILSWGSPATLWKTLSSYRRHRLFDCADERFIYFNELSELDVRIARHFGIEFLGTRENVGIGRALTRLVNRVRGDAFLFLEELVENAGVTRSRLGRSLDLVRSGEAQVVKLRHRIRHGEPLFTARCRNNEESAPPFLLDSMHWIEDPATRFPGRISRQRLDGEDWFLSAARYSNFTNNPCLYTTALAKRFYPTQRGPTSRSSTI